MQEYLVVWNCYGETYASIVHAFDTVEIMTNTDKYLGFEEDECCYISCIAKHITYDYNPWK